MTFDEALKALPDLFADKNYTACEHITRQILAVQPHNPVALYFQGHTHEMQGSLKQAAEALELLALSFPHNPHFFECATRVMTPDTKLRFIAEHGRRHAEVAKFPNKPALELVNNPAGKMFVPVFPDLDAIAQVIRAGEIFDINIVQCAQEYIRPGQTVIDIGANFGQMTLLLSQLAGPSGQVLSFEADDYIHHILSENIRINQRQNVKTFQRAVHHKNKETVYFPDQDFSRFPTYGSYGIDPHASSGRAVETITIDSLDLEYPPIGFMKVDVQGSDLFAMQGARDTIRRHQMPIIFEYEEQFQQEFATTFQDYVDFVSSIGYRFVKTIDSINYLIAPR